MHLVQNLNKTDCPVRAPRRDRRTAEDGPLAVQAKVAVPKAVGGRPQAGITPPPPATCLMCVLENTWSLKIWDLFLPPPLSVCVTMNKSAILSGPSLLICKARELDQITFNKTLFTKKVVGQVGDRRPSSAVCFLWNAEGTGPRSVPETLPDLP